LFSCQNAPPMKAFFLALFLCCFTSASASEVIVFLFDGYDNHTPEVERALKEFMVRRPQCMSVLEGERYVKKVVYADGGMERVSSVLTRFEKLGRSGGLRSFLFHFCEENALDLSRVHIIYRS